MVTITQNPLCYNGKAFLHKKYIEKLQNSGGHIWANPSWTWWICSKSKQVIKQNGTAWLKIESSDPYDPPLDLPLVECDNVPGVQK